MHKQENRGHRGIKVGGSETEVTVVVRERVVKDHPEAHRILKFSIVSW